MHTIEDKKDLRMIEIFFLLIGLVLLKTFMHCLMYIILVFDGVANWASGRYQKEQQLKQKIQEMTPEQISILYSQLKQQRKTVKETQYVIEELNEHL